MMMTVVLGKSSLTVERDCFVALLEASVVADAATFRSALESSRISFADLQALASAAQIPYSLFFAPMTVVSRALAHKTRLLLEGITKKEFSLNSRGNVRVADVEVIVRDLLRKQERLKQLDPKLPENSAVNSLRRSRQTVAADAVNFCKILGIDMDVLRASRTKEAAFAYLVGCYEGNSVFVSQRAQNFMPQRIPDDVRFSGMCIRDRKIPFLFLNTRDEVDSFEPAGRRVLTLVLLGICVARGRFQLVSYNEQSDQLISNREYETAEEVLMPAKEMRTQRIDSIDDVRLMADEFKVTPSAVVMRARRLQILTVAEAAAYLADLRRQFVGATPPFRRTPKPVNALRRYNGAEYSRRLLVHLDEGRISTNEVTRILFQNKLTASDLPEFRASL